ncbi:MAG: hypothetical protein ABIG89_04520 [Candidatus Woesearchaeota archaeon]
MVNLLKDNKKRRIKFRSKQEYEQKLNELIGFDERNYIDLY